VTAGKSHNARGKSQNGDDGSCKRFHFCSSVLPDLTENRRTGSIVTTGSVWLRYSRKTCRLTVRRKDLRAQSACH
jgi:hypothetical protein